jgi:hypothetical protein
MTAPELPEPMSAFQSDYTSEWIHTFTAAQMHALYRQGFAAGMEAAAEVAEKMTIKNGVKLFDRGYNGGVSESAAAIRAACAAK